MNVCRRLYNFGRNYLIISSFMILLYKYTVYIFSSFRIALFVITGLSHSMTYAKKSLDEMIICIQENQEKFERFGVLVLQLCHK